MLSLLMTLLMVHPDQWVITWKPHPENKGIRIVYRCETGTPFFAYNWFDIEPDQSSAYVHRVEIPEDSTTCWATAAIMRGDPFDPETDYVGEYQIVRVQ